jgi:hypothetical protein
MGALQEPAQRRELGTTSTKQGINNAHDNPNGECVKQEFHKTCFFLPMRSRVPAGHTASHRNRETESDPAHSPNPPAKSASGFYTDAVQQANFIRRRSHGSWKPAGLL